jgi:hypothetical protein
MELEGSLPHKQEPFTSPYPETDRVSPCPIRRFLKKHFKIFLPSMLLCDNINIFINKLLSIVSAVVLIQKDIGERKVILINCAF